MAKKNKVWGSVKKRFDSAKQTTSGKGKKGSCAQQKKRKESQIEKGGLMLFLKRFINLDFVWIHSSTKGTQQQKIMRSHFKPNLPLNLIFPLEKSNRNQFQFPLFFFVLFSYYRSILIIEKLKKVLKPEFFEILALETAVGPFGLRRKRVLFFSFFSLSFLAVQKAFGVRPLSFFFFYFFLLKVSFGSEPPFTGSYCSILRTFCPLLPCCFVLILFSL